MEDFQIGLEIVREILKDYRHVERLYGQRNKRFYSIKYVADIGIDRRLCRIRYKNLRLEIFTADYKSKERKEGVKSVPLRNLDDLYDYADLIQRAAETYGSEL